MPIKIDKKGSKKLSGYASIDNPQAIGASFLEKHPIMPNTNIYTIIKLLSSFYLNKPAIDCVDLKASYRDLINDSATISLALKELGVQKGNIVSISMPNFYQAVAMFLACNRIGAVTTFLDFSASQKEISDYLNLFESPIFINYDKNDDYNKQIKDSTKVQYIITLDKKNVNSLYINNNYHITSSDNTIDFNSLGSIAKFKKGKFESFHSSKEDALILFTSGSTGKPKSVVLTNKNIMAAEIYAKNTSHTENIELSKTLICVPFSYPYGFITSALTTLLWGKEAILAPDISKDTISYYYSKEPNMIFGSPALLDLTIANIPRKQDLSFVTHFVSGGDFLTPSHMERGLEFFEKHGATVEIGNGYGNAETVSCGSTPVGLPIKKGSAGKILVGSKAMIIEPDNLEEKKYGEEGELYIAGDHVFKEYYQEPELTKKSKIQIGKTEYYKTGTLGYIEEDGYFTVTGRQSRFYIMSSLNKVYCDNVQNIISTFDCVRDCAVVKVPDDEYLFVNKAYVVLDDGFVYDNETLDYISNLFLLPSKTADNRTVQLKKYEIPTYLEIVDSLPRKVGSDKIDYHFLEEDAIQKVSKSKKILLRK